MKTMLLAGSICGILCGGVLADGDYRFEVDGKARDLWVQPVFGLEGEPAPGEIE